MQDTIARIVDVKEMREDRATEEVRKCRLALEAAARRVEQTKEELETYRQWRVKREIQMWDEIEQKLVRLRDIEDMKTDIGLMRGKEQVYQQKILEAEKTRKEASATLGSAQATLDLAVKARQKFEELADWLEAEAKAYRDRVEELELEEQASSSRRDDDEDRFVEVA